MGRTSRETLQGVLNGTVRQPAEAAEELVPINLREFLGKGVGRIRDAGHARAAAFFCRRPREIIAGDLKTRWDYRKIPV